MACGSHRIQLERGSRVPAGAVRIVRGTRWESPFQIWHPAIVPYLREQGDKTGYYPSTIKNRHWAATALYRLWLYGHLNNLPPLVRVHLHEAMPEPPAVGRVRAMLSGKILACFCALDRSCHGDILANIARSALPEHPPLIGSPPERRPRISHAEHYDNARQQGRWRGMR